jgi:hypothetical protein
MNYRAAAFKDNTGEWAIVKLSISKNGKGEFFYPEKVTYKTKTYILMSSGGRALYNEEKLMIEYRRTKTADERIIELGDSLVIHSARIADLVNVCKDYVNLIREMNIKLKQLETKCEELDLRVTKN